jgi:molybdate transport system permease protein
MSVNWLKATFIFLFALFLILVLSAYLSLFGLIQKSSFISIILSAEFLRPLLFSLFSSTTATLLAGLFAIPSAYILSRYPFPGRELAEGILYLPVLVPPLVSGLALMVLFSSPAGNWLAAQGIRFIFTPAGAVLAQFFIATPYALRTIKVSFNKVDQNIEEAAATLGDSPVRVFTRVTLPLARKGVLSGLLLAWARALGEFGATIMLAGTLARYSETLPVAIYLRFSTGELETAVTMAVMMMLAALVILIATRRFLTTD